MLCKSIQVKVACKELLDLLMAIMFMKAGWKSATIISGVQSVMMPLVGQIAP